MHTRDLQQLYVVLSLLGLMTEQEAAIAIASLASTSLAKPLPWYLDVDAVQEVRSLMLETDQLWLDAWINQQLMDYYAIAARGVEAVKLRLPDGRVQLYISTHRQIVCLWVDRMPATGELVARLSA